MARSRNELSNHPFVVDLDAVANRLAQVIRTQVLREEDNRRVNDPIALPVNWHRLEDCLIDRWDNICRVKGAASVGPLALDGELDQIVVIYKRIPSGRLVILGEGGAGKSVLAARLALGLLAERKRGDPVPVVVSMASWNPTEVSLGQWLTGRLVRDYPFLAGPTDRSPCLATALLDTGQILPILDGFDEISPSLQASALGQLHTTASMPLVLTSRRRQYATAVSAVGVLTNAAGVELNALDLADIEGYLPRTTRRSGNGDLADPWSSTLLRMREHPHERIFRLLVEVLSTPLMVYLARTAYSDTPGRDPSELLDDRRFPNRAALEEHLLAAYVPALYQRLPPSARRWGTEKPQHWFTYLAMHLTRFHTRDLAWWELRNSLSSVHRRLVFGIMGGLTGLLSAWTADLTGHSGIVLVFALACGFGCGLLGWMYLTILTAVAGWYIFEHIAGIDDVMSCSLIGASTFALFFGRDKIPAKPIAAIRIEVRDLRKVGQLIGAFLAGGVFGGAVAGAAFVLSNDRPRWHVGVLAFGVSFGLTFALFSYLEGRLKAASLTPQKSLHLDRKSTIRRVLVFGLSFGMSIGFSFGIIEGLSSGLAKGLAAGIVVAVASGGSTAWGQWLIGVRFWLPLIGCLPWSTWAFLADANRQGVLRQVGSVYQFRHALLQVHLSRTRCVQSVSTSRRPAEL